MPYIVHGQKNKAAHPTVQEGSAASINRHVPIQANPISSKSTISAVRILLGFAVYYAQVYICALSYPMLK
jgi:hypothetical protein